MSEQIPQPHHNTANKVLAGALALASLTSGNVPNTAEQPTEAALQQIVDMPTNLNQDPSTHTITLPAATTQAESSLAASTDLHPEEAAGRSKKKKHPVHKVTLPPVVPPTPPETAPVAPEKLPDFNRVDILAQPGLFEIPDQVRNLFRDTVYLNELGCSGFLIRDDHAIPIGFETAEHCLPHERYQGSDGNTYMAQFIGARRGDSEFALKFVDHATELVVADAAQDSPSSDVAFGIFPGHTPEEVLKNYNSIHDQEIGQLSVGQPVFMSGWPEFQENNPHPENMDRQEFAGSLLGTEIVNTTKGESFLTLWAAMKNTTEGAKCSFGASGSEGFVLLQQTDADGKIYFEKRPVGTLAAFWDLESKTYGTPEQAEKEISWAEKRFSTKLPEGTTALCAFTVAANPDVSNPQKTVIKLVNSVNDIPR